MKVILREDYQVPAVDQARQAIRDAIRCLLINSPTGSGKSVMGAALIEMAVLKGKRVNLVVDRLSLVNQWSELLDRYGIEHGVIQSSHPRYRPSLPVQLCSVQTLAKRGWPDADLNMIDECFPGETLVSTISGPKRIDAIRPGDMVLNATGAGLVRSVFSKPTRSLVAVTLSNGTRIRCTPDHPFFTDAGWQAAESLASGRRVYSSEDVRRLWCGTSAEVVSEPRRRDASGEREGLLGSGLLQQILREEAEEPDALGSGATEDECVTHCHRSSAEEQGRQRSCYAGGAGHGTAGAWSRVGGRACGEDQAEGGGRLPALLQDRRSASGAEDRAGAGRRLAWGQEAAGAGREEGRAAEVIRVASVEVEELGSDVPVFNLRVGSHPSYFADGVLVHNCHVVHATVAKQIESGSGIVIGLTATPMTRGLGKHYKRVINVTTTRWLIERGWLKPYRIFSCAEPDMRDVKVKSTGEWDEAESSKKALEVVGDVVQEYLRHGEGRKFICSAVDTAHVQELTRQFLAAGINVAPYTYKELAEDRDDIGREFRKDDSRIRGVVTVTAASRGWDVPSVNCIIMARPLRKSVAEHLQLLGRGLRPYEGQTDCLVLDHSGNCARLFWQTEDFIDNGLSELDDGSPKPKPKKLDKPEVEPTKCPECGHLHRPMPHCPACGFAYPRKAAVQHVPGTLKELIAGGHQRELARDIWPQIVDYVQKRPNGKPEWMRAKAIYKGMTGLEIKRSYEDTQPVPCSQEVLNRIRAQQIRFAKRRMASQQEAHA